MTTESAAKMAFAAPRDTKELSPCGALLNPWTAPAEAAREIRPLPWVQAAQVLLVLSGRPGGA